MCGEKRPAKAHCIHKTMPWHARNTDHMWIGCSIAHVPLLQCMRTDTHRRRHKNRWNDDNSDWGQFYAYRVGKLAYNNSDQNRLLRSISPFPKNLQCAQGDFLIHVNTNTILLHFWLACGLCTNQETHSHFTHTLSVISFKKWTILMHVFCSLKSIPFCKISIKYWRHVRQKRFACFATTSDLLFCFNTAYLFSVTIM